MRRQRCQKTAEWRKWAIQMIGSSVQFKFYTDYRKKYSHQILTGYIFKKPKYINLKSGARGYKAVYNVFLPDGTIHALNKVISSSVKKLDEENGNKLTAQWMLHQLAEEDKRSRV